MDWAADELLKVMSMDLEYFEKTAPVIKTMLTIIIAVGWALLLGNLIYQAIRTMLHGAGFESEDPKILGFRTAVFAFLLIVSRDICNIGLSISGQIIEWLQIPEELGLVLPAESAYDVGSSARWLIAIIVGFILIFQIVKLLFEVGERYVVLAILTYFAPLAFGLGGSKNTQDIFKSWCRMFCSMLVMMIMSTAFLKLMISAMEHAGDGNILVWVVFVVALARVARKIDSHIARIGLNPAITGDGLGSRIPGVLTAVAVRTMASTVRHNGQMGSVPIAPSSPGGSSNAGNSSRPAGAGSPMSKFSNTNANTTSPSQSIGKTSVNQNTSRATENQFGGNTAENNMKVNRQQDGAIRPGTAQGRITPDLAGNKPGVQSASMKNTPVKPEPNLRMGTNSSQATVQPVKGGLGTQEQARTPIQHINAGGQSIKGNTPMTARAAGIGQPQVSAAHQSPGKPGISPVSGTTPATPVQHSHDSSVVAPGVSNAGANPVHTTAVRPGSAAEGIRPVPSGGSARSAGTVTQAGKTTVAAGTKESIIKGSPGHTSTKTTAAEKVIAANTQHTAQSHSQSQTKATPVNSSSNTKMVSPKAYQSEARPAATAKPKVDPASINKTGRTYQNRKPNKGPKRGD